MTKTGNYLRYGAGGGSGRRCGLGYALAVDDRECAARDANEALFFVLDAYLPDLRTAAAVKRGRRRGDDALGLPAEMVGVELQPHRRLPLAVDVHEGTDRGHGFRERCRCAAMEESEWLAGLVIHRHRRDHPVRRQEGDLDPDCPRHSLVQVLADVGRE